MVLKKLLSLIMVVSFVLVISGCGADEEVAYDENGESETTTEEVDRESNERDTLTEYYVSVDPGSSLTVRATPGTTGKAEDDVIERVSGDQTVIVTDKHNNSISQDGYIWWEIRITASGNSGWAASDFLSAERDDVPDTEAETDGDTREEVSININDYNGASREVFTQAFGQPDETIVYPGLEYNYYKDLSAVVYYNRLLNKNEVAKIIVFN